jgi:hypothetical protein
MRNHYRESMKLYLLLLALGSSCAALAQNVNGIVAGSVLDPDGAVVSNARVRALLPERQGSRETTTNDAGQYRFVGLTPGLYNLTVEAPGFAVHERTSLEVSVGSPLQVDIQLSVSAVSGSVTVTESLDDVARSLSSATRGALFNEQALQNIPALAGRTSRNYSSQVFLLPGTNVSRTPHAPFSINGSRGQGMTNVMVDGADFNNPNTGSLLGANFTEQPVSQEALQTVEVQTSNFKAEYGRAGGGTINLITPSGGNQFHGRFYEFFRNDALDARNTLNAERPTLRQNQFGGLLSGPIIRNRLFFAANGEWMLQRAANSAVPQATFSQAERDRAAPVMRDILAIYPLPNATSATNVPLFDPGRIAEVLTGRTWFGKLDWLASEKHQFGYRYTHAESLRRAANNFATGSAGWNEVYSHTFNLTSTLTPNTVNEARAYYTSYNIPLWPMTPLLGNPAVNGTVGLLSVTGAASLGTIFRDDSRTHNYQVQNDLSLTRGRHGIKLGIIARRVQIATTSRSLGDGQLVFDSRELFLQGRPRTYTRVLGDTRLDQQQYEAGFYGQTDYRVRQNLTLNLGARAEHYGAPADRHGRLTPNYGTGLSVAPRFGFAYTPGTQQSLVLRGGYGLFIAPLAARYVGLTRLTPPRVRTVIALNPAMSDLLGGPLVDSTNLTLTDPNLRQPYVQQWNLTTDYRLPGSKLVASLGYVGTRGVALPMTRLPNGGDRLAPNLRPNPAAGVISLLETAAVSSYHALQFSLNGQVTRQMTLRTSYTWSRSIDDVSRDTVNIIAQNNRRLDRAVSDFHLSHNFTTAMVYTLPGAGSGSFARTLFGGWQISPVVQWRSGFPFSILSGGDTPEGVRLNRVNDIPGTLERGQSGVFGLLPGSGLTLAQVRQQITPANNTFGTLGRNTERAMPFFDLSAGLQKSFRVTERLGLETRVEAFNLLNKVNYDVYSGNLLDPRFGQATSAFPARQIQILLRISF